MTTNKSSGKVLWGVGLLFGLALVFTAQAFGLNVPLDKAQIALADVVSGGGSGDLSNCGNNEAGGFGGGEGGTGGGDTED